MISNDLTGKKINHWTILQELGGGKVLCQCDCEEAPIKELYKKAVISGRTKSCGCAYNRRHIGNITGQRFGNWVVLQELGHGKVLCQCQCENNTIRELYKKAVVNGQTLSCGCQRSNNCYKTKLNNGSIDSKYIGHNFGEWTVLYRLPKSHKFRCRCSCGTERDVYIQHLMSGDSKSCGCKHIVDITGKQFGNWIVLEELGGTKVRCKCLCGKSPEKILYKQTLIRGKSRSCGCLANSYNKQTLLDKYNEVCTLKINNPREQWQIDTLAYKEKFVNFIKSLDEKPSIKKLTELLNVNKSTILRSLHDYDAFDLVTIQHKTSYLEEELYNYIIQITDCNVSRNANGLIDNNLEIDVYIDELKLGFEFDGDYWHSEFFKLNTYHRDKTILALKNNIRIIHIFEHEWINNREDIELYIKDAISKDKDVIYARNTTIIEIDNTEAKKFLEMNHLQKYTNSNINIALYFNNSIVSIMTFGRPRFDNNYEYEMIRFCNKINTIVVGGAKKIFKYFINKYSANSIVSYCDISKFTGDIYKMLGFKLDKFTEPNYVWCNSHNNVMTRYQTQKHKLLELGIGNENQTEEDIMHNIGFFKVYNCGNIKFVWNNKEEVQ